MGFSQDLRERIVSVYEEGELTQKQTAGLLRVGTATVSRVLRRKRETGSAGALPHAGGPAPLIGEADLAALSSVIDEKPDRTLDEFVDAWLKKTGVRTSDTTMWRALRLVATRKKKSFHAAEADTARVRALHAEFIKLIKDVPIEKLLFLDETGSNLGMTPSHAWSSPGTRAPAKKVARGSNLSILGAIGVAGMGAWFGYDGAVDGERFLEFITARLVPTLKPGDVVVMDNASIHKVDGVAEAIEAAGAKLAYLPPYSPDLNPIELVWSQLKQWLKKCEARTVVDWYRAVDGFLRGLTRKRIEPLYWHAKSFHQST